MPFNPTMKKVALILAGGNDLQFWPKSTQNNPKQFVHLFDDTTLFQRTFAMVSSQIPRNDIWVIVNVNYEHLVKEQIPNIDSRQLIREPLARHTAPAVGLALSLLNDRYADDTIFMIFPSDHYIQNIGEFNLSLNTACLAAFTLDGIITIGVQPTRPEVQFGYIQFDDDNYGFNRELYDSGVRYSINFAEKPDKKTAQRFIDSGDFVWNSGILVVKKSVINTAFETHLNYHFEQFNALKNFIDTDEFDEELRKLYKTFNRISLDYGILENADNVYVVKSTFNWTDLNDWDELFRISRKDAKDNVMAGNIITFDSKNCMIFSEDKPVGIVGIEDVVLINTDDAILLCRRGEAHKVKDLVEFMKKRNIPVY